MLTHPSNRTRRARGEGATRASARAGEGGRLMASGNARDIRQLAVAVWPERHCTIQRIRTALFSELTAVSCRRARESHVHRLARLDGHVGQRLVVATRGPAPEPERRLAHADDLGRRRRRNRAFEGRGAPGSARAQLVGLLLQVPDERELRISQRSDLLRQAVDGLWIRDVAETARPVRRRRLVWVVGPAEWLAARVGPLRRTARRLRDLAHLRIVALRAGRERRVVPNLLVVRVALEGTFAQDVVGVGLGGQCVASRRRLGHVLPLARDPDVVRVGPPGGDALVLAVEVLDRQRRPLGVRESNQVDQAEAALLLVAGCGVSLLVEIFERPVVLEMVVSVALVEDVVAV